MNEKHHSLVYHSQHRRHVRGGCLPVFFLLALAALLGCFMLVRIVTTPPLAHEGVGNVLHRKDQQLETEIRQRSPLPLRLPRYIAPLRQDEGVVNFPLRRSLGAADVPEESPFATAPDSVVLNATTLLELPPEEGEPEAVEPQAAADVAADGKEGE